MVYFAQKRKQKQTVLPVYS